MYWYRIYLACISMLIKSIKIIVLVFIVCFCVNVSSVFAIDKSDCGTFGEMSYVNWSKNGFAIINLKRWTNYTYSNFLSAEQQLAIIDKESLNTAMLNLQKYCCENWLWWLDMEHDACKNAKEFFNDNIIDSPYLFDHLFDVVMRRFSGLTGEYDIYTKTNMSWDDRWMEWRSRINEQAEDLSGANPQIIINKYLEFWQPSSPQSWYDIADKINKTFGYDDDTFLKYVNGQWWSDESLKVAEALKNYNDWSLYDRYNNACAITQYLYRLLNYWVDSRDEDIVIQKMWICGQVVKRQIDNENSYVQLVILQSGNLFLQNYRQWYLSYLYGRSQKLQKTWSDITDKFLDVVRAVPQLVHTCVK